ncbi:MAG: metalloregulator ArsR/SmtB family transcription factor, partial [Bacteroidota bacterium]
LYLHMHIRKTVNIEQAEEAIFIATIASALSHPVRVALLHYVRQKDEVSSEVCNKDLVAHFPYSQSSLSQHVRKLKDCGLFRVEYKDKFSLYSVNEEILAEYIDAIQKL